MSATLHDGWTIDPLGDVAHVYAGGTPSRGVQAYWGGDIPWVTTAEVDNCYIASTRESITPVGLSASAARVAPAGTLLMAMYGQGKTRGKVAMLQVPAAMNQACAAVEVGSRLDARYLFQYLQSQYDAIRAMSNSGSQDNLSGELVRRIPVVVPPIHEQRSMVGVLDNADGQVATLTRSIVKKQALRHGLAQQLLTGTTRLTGFTAPWRSVLLGDHLIYVPSVALSRAQLDSESPTRYLHYGDIHGRTGVRLDAAAEPMPRASINLLQNAGRLAVGDLVFADASEDRVGVGKSVEITNVPASGVVAGLHTIAARFDKAVLADGFKGYLQRMPTFRQALLRLAAGTKVLATTRSSISGITITLPDVDEQRAIAAVLTDADHEIEVLERRLVKARDIKHGIMQEVLTGRTRLPVQESAA